MRIGEFIKLSNKCSAGCLHCPFTEAHDHFSVKEIMRQIDESKKSLIVLSGGEPMEHPEITQILRKSSRRQNKIFRIATGSHILLNDYIDLFKSLSNLTGISLGTDILFKGRNNKKLVDKFYENIRLLDNARINYSITLTVGSDIKIDEISNILNKKNINPVFFLIQSRDDESIDHEFINLVAELIKNRFGNMVIHYANID